MTYEPLAAKIRPETLNDIFGQDHILGQNMLLRRMIEADTLSSIILYGPPGIGKTTIAHVIANMTKCNFKRKSVNMIKTVTIITIPFPRS